MNNHKYKPAYSYFQESKSERVRRENATLLLCLLVALGAVLVCALFLTTAITAASPMIYWPLKFIFWVAAIICIVGWPAFFVREIYAAGRRQKEKRREREP